MTTKVRIQNLDEEDTIDVFVRNLQAGTDSKYPLAPGDIVELYVDRHQTLVVEDRLD